MRSSAARLLVGCSVFNYNIMKRLFLALTLLLTTAGFAFAQSVTVNKIWLEKDVTLNSKLGMKIHFFLQTDGLKDVPMSAIAYFDEPKGIGVKDTDGHWCTTSGTVAIWADFTPIYEISVWSDFWFFVAYEDVHIKDYSKTYYCHVFICDKQGKQYGNTEYVDFQVKQPLNKNARNSHLVPAANTMPDDGNRYICYKDEKGRVASVRTSIYNGDWKAVVYDGATGNVYGFTRQYVDDTKWVFKGGLYSIYSKNSNVILHIALDWSYINVNGAIYDIPISKQEYDVLIPKVKGYSGNGGGYNSGSSSNSHYHNHESSSHVDERCKYCGGGGGCSSCNGTGWKYNPYSGYHDKCPSCNGSGRCFNCHGTGKQAIY